MEELKEKIEKVIIDKIKKSDKKKNAHSKTKSVNQLTIAKQLALKLGMNISEIENIIEEEQKLTMFYVGRGYKVIKKNYIIITPKKQSAKKWTCPINKKEYEFPERLRVSITAGMGFKKFVNKTQMPDKLCRFVKQ